VLHRSIVGAAAGLGVDGAAYRRLFGPLAGNWRKLSPYLLGPQLRLPRHPLLMARFGLSAIQPAAGLARRSFRDPRTRALFVGIAAHANVDLERPLTAGFGLVLGAAAHAAGWPFAAGGSQSIVDSLARLLESLGGE